MAQEGGDFDVVAVIELESQVKLIIVIDIGINVPD